MDEKKNGMNWDLLNQNSKYWKATPGKEYIIEVGNWSIERRTFGNTGPGKYCLVVKVYSQNVDGQLTVFEEPKEFATENQSYCEPMKEIIRSSEVEGKDRMFIQIVRNLRGKYLVFPWRPRGV